MNHFSIIQHNRQNSKTLRHHQLSIISMTALISHCNQSSVLGVD